jgi:SOS-response transcriptional repressor LexA
MRSGQSLVPMSEDQLRRIFAEGQPDWLDEPSKVGLTPQEVVDLLDTQAFFELLKQPYPQGRDGVIDRLLRERLLEQGPGGLEIRRLGALLLAKQLTDFPDLSRKAPRAVVYTGTAKTETRLDQPGTKGYAVGFQGLVRFVMAQLPQNEVIEDALRREEKLVPETAIRELVANALIHQDFSVTGASVMVEIYSNRVEISNPGEPIVPVERWRTPRWSSSPTGTTSTTIETAKVIEKLIQLAKEMREAGQRGAKLGLTEDEVAFYDALETNDSAVKVLGDEALRTIARELVATVRANVTIDWTVRENVRAQLRVLVKRVLRKHGYPPDMEEKATRTVLEQAEVLCADWADAAPYRPRTIVPRPQDRYVTCVPLVPLRAAAGAFGDPQHIEEGDWEWVVVETQRRLRPGMFVAQVAGKSMEPAIPDGSWCLFSTPVAGTREGKTVLVQLRDAVDPETGERYTVKRYESEKTQKGKSWRHTRITLKPLNPAFPPIELEAGDEERVRVVAEVVEALGHAP